MSLLQTVLSFLAALTLLIFVHEAGHYLAARWCQVKVLRFSIGFGRPLLRWRSGRDGTEWVIAMIPLGGYVRMLDERDREPGEAIDPAELPHAFSRRPLSQRALIVVAGPLANFLLAILLYAVLAWSGTEQPVAVIDQPVAGSAAERSGLHAGDRVVGESGRAIDSWGTLRLRAIEAALARRPLELSVEREGQRTSVRLETAALPPGAAEDDVLGALGLRLEPGQVLISKVVIGDPAEVAGLVAGDRILAIQGVPVRRASEVIEHVRAKPGSPIDLLVLRGRDEISMQVVPLVQSDPQGLVNRGRIGAMLQDRVRTERVSFGALDGLEQGITQTWQMSAFSLRMLGRMLTGDLSMRQLSGPVTIADLAGQSARSGLESYLGFLALISISLGVLNLLPVPVLDGGHLVYYAAEAVRGRPLSERTLALTQRVGLALVVMLMAVALYNDVARLFGL